MNQQTFEKLKTKVKQDLTITESNIVMKCLEVPKLFMKYNEIFVKQLDHYKNLLLEKDRLYGDLYEHYKYNGKYSAGTKGEVEAFLYADERWIELNREVIKQECITKYVENVLSDVKQLNFNLKNFIEYKKYLEGLV